jgi:hypothetical protein
MPRLRPLLPLTLLIPMAGCMDEDNVVRRVEGETLFITDHWTNQVPFVVIGVIFLVMGVTLLAGVWKLKKRSRLAGVFFTLLGAAFAHNAVLSAPYSYVAVDSQQLYVHKGDGSARDFRRRSISRDSTASRSQIIGGNLREETPAVAAFAPSSNSCPGRGSAISSP